MDSDEESGYQVTTLVETLSEPPIDDDLKADLKRTFASEAIKLGEIYRSVYSRDGSYFEFYPQAVVRVSSTSEVEGLPQIGSQRKVPITVRAAGSSLSGQTVGTGVIADLRPAWKKFDIRDRGRRIWLEPGLTVDQIDHLLAPLGRKIGPDPASSKAAMMGGVLSNNGKRTQDVMARNRHLS